MGSINKLKNGKFKVSAYDKFGVRFRPSFNNSIEAKAYISKVESFKHEERLIGKKIKKKRTLMEDSLNQFDISKSQLRPRSIQKYKNVIYQLRLFCQALNIVYLDEFTTDHSSLLYQELVKEKIDPTGNTKKILKPKAKTVNFYLQTIRAFFLNEVVVGHLDRSPFLHIRNLKIDKQIPEYYSIKEVDDFFAQEMDEAYRNAFTALLHTGLRFEELASLTWDDIDLSRKLLHIRPKDNFRTKTDNSIRSIPMNEVMVDLITKINYNRKSELHPFCSEHGKKILQKVLLRIAKRIGKKAKISGRIFLHKWRHTFATHLVLNRVPIEVVQKLMGHSSIKETMVYAHVRSEETHTDVELLSNLFNRPKEKK